MGDSVPAAMAVDQHASAAHGKRRRWALRIGVGLVALVVVYVLIGSWVASSLVGDLSDKVQAEVNAGAGGSSDPFDIAYRGDPGEAFGYTFENVMIPTELGDAPAWFVPGEGTTWAIFVHGIGGARENGYRHLSVHQSLAIPTLLITYRNDEGAPADPSGMYGFGVTEWRDLDAAVAYALAHGAEKIILDGESMGGSIIGEFLRRSNHVDQVVAVILDAPALDLRIVARGFMRENNVPLPTSISFLGLWIADQRYEVPIGTSRTINMVVNYPGPLFLAHGSGDPIVPIEISNDVIASRHGLTTFLRTEAEHIMSWNEDPERYRTWLRSFLETVIQPGS